MKNFTKQITNKTLFKPTRWLLVALMLLVGTGSAWGATYLSGTFNGWNAVDSKYLFSSGTLSVSMSPGTYEFKVVEDGKWYSMNDTNITGTVSSGITMYENNNNNNITITYTGVYTFIWDGTNNKLKVTYPPQCATCCTNYYVAGDAGLCGEGWNANADKMDCDDNVWSKTFTGVNNGTYYFQITNGTWDVKNGEFDNSKGNITLSNKDDGYGAKKIKLTTTSKGDITIYFDGEKAWVDFAEWGIFLVGDEAQLNLGDVEVGQSKTVQIEFEYYGITGINPQLLDIQTGFSGSGSLNSNTRTITYNITFTPIEAGKKTATIYIAYANGGLYKQQISANGIVVCEPTATLKSASYNATTKKIDLSGSMDPCGKDLYYGFLWRKQGDNWVADNAHAISGTGDSYNKSSEPKEFSRSWSDFEPGSTYEFTAYALEANSSTWYYNPEGIEVSTCIDVQTPSVTASATEVCQNADVTLTLNNKQEGVTYTINGNPAFVDNNEFTATNLQNDITYTIAASSTTACTNDPKQAEVNITVLKPSFDGAYIGFIVPQGSNAASYTACDDVTLQTWIQGATQYTIYENNIETGDATGKTTGSTPITYKITGKSAGTYEYKVVYEDACDNTFTTGTITLTVPATIDRPKYTLKEPTKCGNSETPGSLAITQVGGISYTINDIVTNNLTLEAADHIQPQTYTITATKTTGSCTRTATTEVTVQTIDNTPVVNDIAITTANTTVCAGSELTLQLVGDAQDGVSFQWYKGSDAIVGATSSSLTIQNVTASDAGDYKLVASKTTPCTVTKESKIITISVDAKSKIEVSAAESFCLGISVNLTKKVTDATGTVTWYTDNTGTQVVDNTYITVSGDITYYAKAKNGICPATEAAPYAITAKGVTISQTPATVHPYEVTIFTASGNASWEISTNPSEGAALDSNDPVFSGKTTAYITKADGKTTTFKGETATGYVIKATAEECPTTHTFNVEDDPDNCKQ